jgi:type I restriction enzyme S subunit
LAISVGSLSPTINWKTLKAQEFALPPLEEQTRMVLLYSAISETYAEFRLVGDATHALRRAAVARAFHEQGPEWHVSTLGEVADLTIGRTPPRKEKKYWTSDLRHPFCTIADMTGPQVLPTREGVTDVAIAEGKAKRVPAGALLMSFKLTIGRLGFAATDLFPNEAIVWIRPSADVSAEYLKIWLEYQDLESLVGRAVKGKTLNGPALRSIPVSYPSRDVQETFVRMESAIGSFAASTERHQSRIAALRAAI